MSSLEAIGYTVLLMVGIPVLVGVSVVLSFEGPRLYGWLRGAALEGAVEPAPFHLTSPLGVCYNMVHAYMCTHVETVKRQGG